MVSIINEKDFDSQVKNGIKVVDFYASWCGPCAMLAPELEELADRINDIDVLKVNVDENQNLCMTYSIEVVPTMLFFKDGKLIRREEGYYKADDLMMIVNSLR